MENARRSLPAAAGVPRAFVYGTLLLPAVRERVTPVRLTTRPASLAGFERRCVRGATYPSLVPARGGKVEGLLLEGIDAAMLAAFDAYEGPRYARILVQAECDGALVEAWVWLLGPRYAADIGGESWDLARFEREHLARFLAEYEGLHGGEPTR